MLFLSSGNVVTVARRQVFSVAHALGSVATIVRQAPHQGYEVYGLGSFDQYSYLINPIWTFLQIQDQSALPRRIQPCFAAMDTFGYTPMADLRI